MNFPLASAVQRNAESRNGDSLSTPMDQTQPEGRLAGVPVAVVSAPAENRAGGIIAKRMMGGLTAGAAAGAGVGFFAGPHGAVIGGIVGGLGGSVYGIFSGRRVSDVSNRDAGQVAHADIMRLPTEQERFVATSNKISVLEKNLKNSFTGQVRQYEDYAVIRGEIEKLPAGQIPRDKLASFQQAQDSLKGSLASLRENLVQLQALKNNLKSPITQADLNMLHWLESSMESVITRREAFLSGTQPLIQHHHDALEHEIRSLDQKISDAQQRVNQFSDEGGVMWVDGVVVDIGKANIRDENKIKSLEADKQRLRDAQQDLREKQEHVTGLKRGRIESHSSSVQMAMQLEESMQLVNSAAQNLMKIDKQCHDLERTKREDLERSQTGGRSYFGEAEEKNLKESLTARDKAGRIFQEAKASDDKIWNLYSAMVVTSGNANDSSSNEEIISETATSLNFVKAALDESSNELRKVHRPLIF